MTGSSGDIRSRKPANRGRNESGVAGEISPASTTSSTSSMRNARTSTHRQQIEADRTGTRKTWTSLQTRRSHVSEQKEQGGVQVKQPQPAGGGNKRTVLSQAVYSNFPLPLERQREGLPSREHCLPVHLLDQQFLIKDIYKPHPPPPPRLRNFHIKTMQSHSFLKVCVSIHLIVATRIIFSIKFTNSLALY